jgi:hypothetical protein
MASVRIRAAVLDKDNMARLWITKFVEGINCAAVIASCS